MPLIAAFVARLQEALPDVWLVVVGHTDSKDTDAFNLALSLDRAQSFMDEAAAVGWPQDQVLACGRGEQDLLVPDMADGEFDPVAGQANRRVEVWFAPNDSDPKCEDLEQTATRVP